MNDPFKEPFRITIEHYDEKVSIEKNHSDLTVEEVIDMIIEVIAAAGFTREELLEELRQL